MATIYTGINEAIDAFQARIFANEIDVHDSIYNASEMDFTPPHPLRPCTRFQWFHNDVALDGEINDTYTVPTNTVASSGTYYCIITIGDDPTACITEQTDTRTVSIVDCKTTQYNVASTSDTTDITIDYSPLEPTITAGSFASDDTWISVTIGATTEAGGIKSTVVTFNTQGGQARRATSTLTIGDFSCIYAFTQAYIPRVPPPVTPPDPALPGAQFLSIFNDGPSAISAQCDVYEITLGGRIGDRSLSIGGAFSLDYVTCLGETARRAWGVPAGSSNRSITVTANNDLQGTITAADINIARGQAEASDFTITSSPAEGAQAAVTIIPEIGYVPDANTDNITALVQIDGVTIDQTIMDGFTDISTGVRAHFVLPGIYDRSVPNRVSVPIQLVSDRPGTWNLIVSTIDTTLGAPAVPAFATAGFQITGVAEARTNGIVSGDTIRTVRCDGGIQTGTFEVEAGTARIAFDTAGVPLGTFSSDPNYLFTSYDFQYTITGNGVNITGVIPASGNSLRRNEPGNLGTLSSGTYDFDIRFIGTCNMGGALGRITVLPNIFN